MKNLFKIVSAFVGTVLVLAFASCKADVEVVEVAKKYASAVVFTASATQNEGEVSVTMETKTEGAVIYYTSDGTEPTAESTKYTEAILVTKDTTFKAIAVKGGMENSPVSSMSITIKDKNIYVDKKADETAPASVTNLTAAAKDGRVLLTWTDAADEDVYGYEVTYNGTSAINRVVLPALDEKTMMVGKGAGGCYVSGLTNGTEYAFTVKTVDTSGNKSEGVTATATPVSSAASETMKIALTADVPHENGYIACCSDTYSYCNFCITLIASVTIFMRNTCI